MAQQHQVTRINQAANGTHLTCSRTGSLGLGGSGSAWQYRLDLPALSQVSSSVTFACSDPYTTYSHECGWGTACCCSSWVWDTHKLGL